jgi:hypothetical protein
LVDESNISIRSIKDLKKIKKTYNIDLDYIIDEYEYKVELEESVVEDTDSPCLNNYEVFNIILKDHWESIKELVNNVSKLNDLEDDVVKKVFNFVKKNFTEYNIYKFSDKSLPIVSIKLVEYDTLNSELLVEVKTSDILSDESIEEVRNFLDVQCADGWGIEVENVDISATLKDKRLVYVNVWSETHEVTYNK